jgi:hypothetical protein
VDRDIDQRPFAKRDLGSASHRLGKRPLDLFIMLDQSGSMRGAKWPFPQPRAL